MGAHGDGEIKYLRLQLPITRAAQARSEYERVCLVFAASLAQVEHEWPTDTV